MTNLYLPANIKLSNPDGTPTQEFLQFWQQNVIGINNAVSAAASAEQKASQGIENLFVGIDGANIAFNGFYTSTPSNVRFEFPQIALSAGEQVVTQAIDLTKDGFTLSNKKLVLGAPVAKTTGAGSYDSGLGYHTAQKPVTDDAYNQIYFYKFDCEIPLVNAVGDGGGGWIGTYAGSYKAKALISGAWEDKKTIYVNGDYTSGTFPPSTLTITGYIEPVEITQTIGMVAGAEFGIVGISTSLVTSFNEVTYETRTITSTSSITDTAVKCWVRT